MKWVDISRWVFAFCGAAYFAWYCWKLKKLDRDNPNSPMWRKLITIELWIIAIFIIMAMNKISIALVI